MESAINTDTTKTEMSKQGPNFPTEVGFNQTQAYPDYNYCDTAVNGWKNRNHVQSELQTTPDMYDTGKTIFRFPSDYLDHWKKGNSVSGYKGTCYADYLPLDLDSDDLELALKTVKEFLTYLGLEHEVDLRDIPVWFSGCKGFHLAIPVAVFGGVSPSSKLPKYFRAFVEDVWKGWGFDLSIYDVNHLLRCENTINSKTGLYKILVDDIMDVDLKTIEERATKPGASLDFSRLYDVWLSSSLKVEFQRILREADGSRGSTKLNTDLDWNDLLKTLPEVGERNNTLFAIARGMRKYGYSEEVTLGIVDPWNKKNSNPLPEKEVIATVKSAFKKSSGTDSQIQYSDMGNAQIFVTLFRDKVRFDFTRQKWYIFHNHSWHEDTKDQIYQLSKKVLDVLRERAGSITDEKEYKRAMTWANQLGNKTRIESMLKLVTTFKPIGIEQSDWNKNDYYIQFENGVYDLVTREFSSGKPEYLMNTSVGFNYDAGKDCPTWKKAILEMMNNDQELVDFLQRAIGYSLTGSTKEQCLFILTGAGSNGKSVTLDTLLNVLGGFGQNSPFNTFEYKSYEQSNDLARLVDARLVTSSETSSSRRLNEERIKAITGNDPVTARFLYREYFTYIPKFKIWLAVNALPEIRGTDNGIWRRIKVIQFDVSFKGREDRDLPNKLHAELPGIMNWAIEGARKWLKSGLKEPSKVSSATNTYRSESDTVKAFLDEFVTFDKQRRVHATALYKAYKEYTFTTGTFQMTQAMFGRQLVQLGYEKRKSNGSYYYIGLSLIETDYDPPIIN